MTTLLTIGLTNAVIASLLAIVVWCVTRVWRQPPVAAILWTLVLVKLVTPPLVAIPWRFDYNPANTAARTANTSTEPISNVANADHAVSFPTEISTLPTLRANATTNASAAPIEPIHESLSHNEKAIEHSQPINVAPSEPLNWTTLLATAWLGGSVLWLLIAVGRLARFHRALRHTSPCTDDISTLADEVAALLGVTSRFRLRMTEACLSPLVWPIGRPTILLSRPLLSAMSHEETEMLLAHELAHVRRKDHWLRWLEFTTTALYWWHPVVWWARTMIQKAEEQSCDAWVVWAFPKSARCYASALFKAVQMATEHRSLAPLVASRLGSTGNLKERIEDIMNATWTCRLTKPARAALALFVILILPLSLRSVTTASEQSPDSNAKATTADNQHDTASPAAKPIDDRVQVTIPEPSTNQPRVRVPANPYRIAAGDVLHVAVANAFADQPIAEDCLVEPEGTIALGPAYGRAHVAGLTLDEADRAVTKHLGKVIQDPVVQVTLGGWRYNVGKWAGRLENATGNVQTAHNTVEQDSHTSSSGARFERPSSPEELVALREHVQFLNDRFKSVDALYKTGSRGGSADARARTAYELASAQAELAVAEGNRAQAIAYCEQAEKFAEETLKNVMASYEAGRVSLDLMLQTAKFVSESKRRLIHLREPQTPTTEQLSKTTGDHADLKRAIAQQASLSDSNTSVSVRQKLVEVTKQKYERMKLLADTKIVPAADLELAKADYDVSIAQLQHAQRTLKYARLLVDLAQTEYDEAIAKNKATPNSVSDFELKKLKIKVEIAQVKASEVE